MWTVQNRHRPWPCSPGRRTPHHGARGGMLHPSAAGTAAAQVQTEPTTKLQGRVSVTARTNSRGGGRGCHLEGWAAWLGSLAPAHPTSEGSPCFPNAWLGGSGWHGGSGCSVAAGSCCCAPDLAHACSLAVNPWERRNPEQSQQRLLAAKRRREPARVRVTPGRPAASPSPATFMGAGQSSAWGPAERWWGTDSGRHLAPSPWPPQGPP